MSATDPFPEGTRTRANRFFGKQRANRWWKKHAHPDYKGTI